MIRQRILFFTENLHLKCHLSLKLRKALIISAEAE